MQELITTVSKLFEQLKDALLLISNEQYVYKNNVLSNASVGQHLRHIIELYQEMINGYSIGEVNYEKRQRDFFIETDKENALQQINLLVKQLNKPDKQLLLTTVVITNNTVMQVNTSFAREIIFNIEHTVHHQALIKIGFAASFGIQLPDAFGVASATLEYRKICVQ